MAKAKQTKSFHFLGEEILPNSRTVVHCDVPKLYTNTALSIPIEVIHGRTEGPVLMINAAIHGDELNGVEIVRQMINAINSADLKGTLICVPIVNVFGFIQKIRYLPDRRDLNRCFPGSEKGSLASRLADTFFNDVVMQCRYIIDIHTGAIHRTNLPQIRADLSKQETQDLAKAFGAPVIINSVIKSGSLRSEAEKRGKTVLTYEGGEALKFDPIAINAGIVGIKRVMQSLGMLRKSRKKVPTSFIANSSTWVRAEFDGILRTIVSLGDKVEKGQTLAYINAPLGHFEKEITATKSGIVIGQQTLPLVNEGDAVFHIAHVSDKNESIEQVVEAFIDEVTDNELDTITTGYITPNT
ncbi:M14 family metallopeptidase [Vibrio sp.]|nr:M14 family metallopeptidase [Vibrio sp.]